MQSELKEPKKSETGRRHNTEIPVVVPVFTIESGGGFTLESFVNAQVCIERLREDLTSNNSCIIGYLSEWITWEMTDNVPLCVTVDLSTGQTTAYINGIKKFNSLKQCMAKLRLSNVTKNGDVVNVERAVFIRSYSFVMSYLLDIYERQYKLDTFTPVPSYMIIVREYITDQYSLMKTIQTLREKQIAGCVDTLLLVAVDHGGYDSIWKYKISQQQQTHFTKMCK